VFSVLISGIAAFSFGWMLVPPMIGICVGLWVDAISKKETRMATLTNPSTTTGTIVLGTAASLLAAALAPTL